MNVVDAVVPSPRTILRVRDNDNCWILLSDLDETNNRTGVILGVIPGVVPGVVERMIRISNATKGCRP